MARPSPIHRDSDADGDDFGCVGRNRKRGNKEVARLVGSAETRLAAGDFEDGDDLIEFIRSELELVSARYDCGCCDTVVKENVFAALADVITGSKIPGFDQLEIYGW